ncbi:MAG: hypothetical protein WAT61_15185, partial [Flavobacteriales bacterium]
MLSLPANTDPVYIAPEHYSAMDRFFLRLINDKRDLPFIYLIFKVSFSIVPLAALLFVPAISGWLWLLIAAVYLFVNNVTYKGPFGLMLHCSSHRPLFRKEVAPLN